MKPTYKKCLSCRGPLLLGITGLSLATLSAKADVSFLGVAAGDASSSNVVLWTRAVDTNAPAAAMLTAQVATDPGFSIGVTTFSVSTDVSKDYTAKTTAGGLASNTRYYYRFVDSVNTNNMSITGTFKTAPDSNAVVPVHFGF
jgi:alkaline phosphatase D